jgi:hypothetical protein
MFFGSGCIYTRELKWISHKKDPNVLATIATENIILEKNNYEDMIEDFISKNIGHIMLFSRS